MNIDEYEQVKFSIYSEFATTVRFILDQAISTAGAPQPQAIQARAKEPSHLRPKLASRNLETSERIEEEIKDLAGVRLIFYTNTDVERFLSSRLIPENFKVHWDENRVHHPVPENNEALYRAVHFTVSLDDARGALPEYARFVDLRCEIQIQTILIHAWAETSHEMIYKSSLTPGFGGEVHERIKTRLERVMNKFLVPAGYELQKAQHDYERLMQGKALFDRGTFESLERAADNNERYVLLEAIQENVLPNYDDVEAIYPEVLRSLASTLDVARQTDVRPIPSAFGDLPGKSAADVTALIVEILNGLRYLDAAATFEALVRIYEHDPTDEVRVRVMRAIQDLAKYNLPVVRKIGLLPQKELADAIDDFDDDKSLRLRPIVLAVWREILSPELSGTTWDADKVTLHRAAVPVTQQLKEVRDAALDDLFWLFEEATSDAERREVFLALTEATRLPYQGDYSDALVRLVIENSTAIAAEMREWAGELSYELLELIEHDFLFQYRRAVQLAETGEGDVPELATGMVESIIAFRDAINADRLFVRYKTLVGFRGVFPAQWDDPNLHDVEDDERLATADTYIDQISEQNLDEWLPFLETCASADSTDAATFPVFGEFLKRLAMRRSNIAIAIFDRADAKLGSFLVALFNGLADSGEEAAYEEVLGQYLQAGQRLSAVMRHLRYSRPAPWSRAKVALDGAIATADDLAVLECLAYAVQHHALNHDAIVGDLYLPALAYLSAKADGRWVNGV